MKKRVVAFGELLGRFDTEGHERFAQAEMFKIGYTGAEANVLAALAHWGISTESVSRVPAHELGQACINFLRRYGIGTESILRGGDRLGLLYVENGASQRPSRVIYDRKGSSFAQLDPAELKWDGILEGAAWLCLSGITPALSPGLVIAQRKAIAAARRKGVLISYDCNYRSTLWSLDQARAVLPELVTGSDLIFGTPYDMKEIFGIEEPGVAGANRLREKFGIGRVAYTFRESPSTTQNIIKATLIGPGGSCDSRSYDIFVIDRIGSGDAFAAGILYGLIEGWPDQRTVEFGAAAACLKHSMPGDFLLSTIDEVNDLAESGRAGRIRR
jgi:2-dehydro-3-deoxygluconokinase